MGLPVARLRVVITTCSLSFVMGPGCFHALPTSSKRLTTFGANRPSRFGGAFRIRLQCLRFSGSSHSSTTVFTGFRGPLASCCFQNHLSVRVTHERAGTSMFSGTFCPAFCSNHIGIVESVRRILTGIEIADQAAGLEILNVLIDLVERYLFIRDATPRCIPAICDEDINFSIAREQLRQLIFDEPNLDRCHVKWRMSSRSDKIE